MNADDALRLTLDDDSLQVHFTASLGPMPVRGRFGGVRGTLVIPADGIEGAELSVEVQAATVSTGLAMRDRHLRGPSFLDVARHPVIRYVNRHVARDNGDLLVAGLLTLRGATREVRARCVLTRHDDGAHERVLVAATLDVPSRAHGVGIPLGIDRLNPIFLAVGARVLVEVTIAVPATRLLPALLPVRGR